MEIDAKTILTEFSVVDYLLLNVQFKKDFKIFRNIALKTAKPDDCKTTILA